MGGFSVVDYVVFASSLVASFVIGIYTAFSGKKEKTTEDFYFGNRDMNIVAVAMSLASTFLSGVGLLGVPSEVYHNGISYIILLIAETICALVAIFLFIPFFYNLRMTSVYEYFEHRFNVSIRRFACLLFVTNMLLYMALVLYAPALALSQVTGLPIWASILVGGLVCTIYTSLGGMEAVIWTDAFQMSIMLIGVITVLVNGIISAGGVDQVISANLETGRLHIIFDPDPTIRHSFWSLFFGGLFIIMPFSLNQATVQRYLSVKNKRAAQKMFAIQTPTILIWWTMLVTIGLAAFAYYQGCDPRMTGRIERADQVVQLFVLDTLSYLKGLPGLFTAVVYSGTLSSVSSGVNSIVVVLTEDFIRPLHDLKIETLIDERRVMRLTKGLSFIVGFTAIGLAFVASLLGRGLIQFCWSIDGMCGGPLLGLFFCGMVLTYCNSKGVAVGVTAGLATTFWIGIGAIFYANPQSPLPLSAERCLNETHFLEHSFTTTSMLMNGTMTNGTMTFDEEIESLGYTYSHDKQEIIPVSILVGLNRIYGVSYQYYGLIGFLVTVTVASIVSLATGRQDPSKIPDRFFLFKSFSKDVKLETKLRSVSKDAEYHSVSTVEAS